MNPAKASKNDGKFFCGCCAKGEEFNSEELIFDYFGKEFSEYEYVIENLAIRPAPKKLLDLVPVHSTNISSKISVQSSNVQNPSSEMSADDKSLKIRDVTSDFISFKSPEEDFDRQSKQVVPRPLRPYSSFKGDLNPRRVIKDITELRQTIKTQEYRTRKQVLSDLSDASEQSLNIPRKNNNNNGSILNKKSMPREIRNTIDTLKFKKPLPQFYTRTEKKQQFHSPGVYFAETKMDSQGDMRSPRASVDDNQYAGSRNTLDILHPNWDGFTDNSRQISIDSMTQTEISKPCPCPKKERKNLKWKIIINRHR